MDMRFGMINLRFDGFGELDVVDGCFFRWFFDMFFSL